MNSEDGACKQECLRMQAKPRTWQKLALQMILSGTQVVQGPPLREDIENMFGYALPGALPPIGQSS